MATSHAEATHHSALQHHFDNLEQQREAGSIGMWVFLVTEIMFFGGLFMAYLLYRYKYPGGFVAGSNHLNVVLGGINTVVLICSSLTMALAVYYAQTGKRRNQIMFLILTIILGAAFLVIKGFEYAEKFKAYLFPNTSFQWEGKLPPGTTTQQVQMFYWIYFAMTGVHALHMIIGIGVISVLVYHAYRGRYTPEYHAPVELTGLYWHFVDIIWIFLFPLLYLLGRHLEMSN